MTGEVYGVVILEETGLFDVGFVDCNTGIVVIFLLLLLCVVIFLDKRREILIIFGRGVDADVFGFLFIIFKGFFHDN